MMLKIRERIYIVLLLNLLIMRNLTSTIKLMDQSTIRCLQINSACECTKPGPVDLGLVFCDRTLKLASLNNHFFYPPRNASKHQSIYNQLSIYKITFKANGIRLVHNLTFQRTGVYNLEIIQQKLVFLPNKCFFGLERTLRQLSLESNQLITVPTLALTGLRKLSYLNLNHNQIRRLISDQLFPISIHSTLKVLLIAHNHLAHIDAFTFNSLTVLQYLDLSSNHLIFLDNHAFSSSTLLSNSRLLYLNLASNRLSLIPFTLLASLSSLQVFDLANNLIGNIINDDSFQSTNFKETVVYRDGQATNVSLSSKYEKGARTICLEYLNLENNQLTRLRNESFIRFSCLRSLNLAANEIEMIENDAFKGVVINELNLRDCKLTKLGSDVWSDKGNQLTHLDLSENLLSTDQQNDTFISLEKLTSFKFNNNVGTFRLYPLSLAQSQYSLMELEFTSINRLSDLHIDSLRANFDPINYEIEFKNLRKLSLTFFNRPSSTGLLNRIEKKQLLAYGDYNLHNLDLSRSFIEDLNDKDLFESTPWLLHLNLSSNRIKRVHANIFDPLVNSLISLDLNSAFHPHLTHTFDCTLVGHLSALQSLSLIENEINQFSHQSCFDQLTELRLLQLDFNELSRLRPNQFEQLKSLVHLQLSNNKLEQLDTTTFNELPKLVYIDLSFNVLKNIKMYAFNDLISLRHINLANNRLQSLELDAFVNLPYLEYIDFSRNQLKLFVWSCFDQIGALSKTLRIDFRANKLESLKDAQSSSNKLVTNLYANGSSTVNSFVSTNQLIMNFIEIIDLTSNELSEIDLNNFQIIRNSLIQLHLDHNRLSRLSKEAFASLPNLQYLSIAANLLTTLPDDLLIEDYSLQEINISSNLLASLPGRLFAHNTKLTTIDLSNNLIKKLPNHLFANCSHLERLYMQHNSLREFPLNAFTNRNLNSIKVISLAFNYIEHLNILAFDIYRALIHLNLSHNSIKQFDLSLFPNLIQLDASFNKFQFNEIENLFANIRSTKLHSLDLSSSGIKQMPILNLPNLLKLNLASNLLTFVYSHSFLHIEQLNILNLSNNRLTNVPNNLFNQKLGETLIELDLSFNPIYSLNNDSFVGLRKLQRLVIHGLHRLHYIQPGVFRSLQLLRVLKLSYYEQITSLCTLLSISSLHIETLVIHFDSATQTTFKRKFLFDSSVCAKRNGTSYAGLGKKLQTIHLIGSIRRLDRDAFNEISNDRLTLHFTNTSIKQLTLDLAVQTLDLYLDKSFQSNPELNTLNFRKKLQLRTVAFEQDTTLNCDCRSTWLREHWKKVRFDASNAIAKWFSIDSLNDNHLHRHKSSEKELTASKLNKNQLEDLFLKQNANLTYEQLIEQNLASVQTMEANLEDVKCEEGSDDNDLILVKKIDEKIDHSFNGRFSFIYLNKIQQMKNSRRKLSILDTFHTQMRSCVRSLSNNSATKLNEINYLIYHLTLAVNFLLFILT